MNVKIEPQHSLELNQLADMISQMSVAMMTTINAAGLLVSRPMAVLEIDAYGSLWFFTNENSGKTDQLETVNISFSDLTRSTYISMSGHGEIYADYERIKRLWTDFAKPWFPEGPDSSSLALLKFVPDLAEYWDAANSNMARLYQTGINTSTDTSYGLGEHGVLTDLSNH